MLILAGALTPAFAACGNKTYTKGGTPVLIPMPPDRNDDRNDDRSARQLPPDNQPDSRETQTRPVVVADSPSSAPAAESAPATNHGQERAAEVHERNEERKAEHDSASEVKQDDNAAVAGSAHDKSDDKGKSKGKGKGKGKGKKGN
ncbi:MAG: hypothetical protein ACAI38_16750 [Myxococcota bacterium]|nr:hypothetical protein [Myxococcota bacterium]